MFLILKIFEQRVVEVLFELYSPFMVYVLSSTMFFFFFYLSKIVLVFTLEINIYIEKEKEVDVGDVSVLFHVDKHAD